MEEGMHASNSSELGVGTTRVGEMGNTQTPTTLATLIRAKKKSNENNINESNSWIDPEQFKQYWN